MGQGGTSDRLKNTRLCLLEALVEENRVFLERSETMVLIRDKRHGRLLLRAAACANTLEARHGNAGRL